MKHAVFVALMACAGGAEASVVDMEASVHHSISISAVYDANGHEMAGHADTYFSGGGQLGGDASTGYLNAWDADGNSGSDSTVASGIIRPAFVEAHFLDPTYYYDANMSGLYIMDHFFRNISGQPLYAVFTVDFRLEASVDVSKPTGSGTAQASLLSWGGSSRVQHRRHRFLRQRGTAGYRIGQRHLGGNVEFLGVRRTRHLRRVANVWGP